MTRRTITLLALGGVLVAAAWVGAIFWALHRASGSRHESFLAQREKLLLGLADQFDHPPAGLKLMTPKLERENVLAPGRDAILVYLRLEHEWFQVTNDSRVYEIEAAALAQQSPDDLALALLGHCEVACRQLPMTGHLSTSSLAGGGIVQQSAWSTHDHDLAVLLRVEVDEQQKQARLERWVVEHRRLRPQ